MATYLLLIKFISEVIHTCTGYAINEEEKLTTSSNKFIGYPPVH